MKEDGNPLPWYKVPTVWLILSIPATAIAVGAVMLTVSIRTFDGLVVDDYYKHGKEINRVLARDHLATRARVRSRFGHDPASGRIVAVISAGDPSVVPDEIEMSFIHPTHSGRDEIVTLKRQEGEYFTAVAQPLGDGRWIVQIQTTDWRLMKTVVLPLEAAVEMEYLQDTGQ